MQLKNPEVLRTWLTKQLKPICKANPEPVAKYVIALLKKEKNDDDLKSSLLSHLEVFLDSATEKFVDFFVSAFENEKYVDGNVNFEIKEPSPIIEYEVRRESDLLRSPTPQVERKSPSPIRAPTPSPPKRTTSRRKSREHKRAMSRRRRESGSPRRPRKRSSSGSPKSPRRPWSMSTTGTKRRRRSASPLRSPSPREKRKMVDDYRRHCEFDVLEPSAPFNQKTRCIDFEEKGYCARGDMCPFDHGPAPIVLDNLLNGIVPMNQAPPQLPALPPPPPMLPVVPRIPFYPPPPPFVNGGPYGLRKPFDGHPHKYQGGRELIPVQTTRPPKNRKPDVTGHVNGCEGVSQQSLEIGNVPPDMNNVPSLHDMFSRFGDITLVECRRMGDERLALVRFASAREASLAHLNVQTVLPDGTAEWFTDKCILNPNPIKKVPAAPAQKYVKSNYVLVRNQPAPKVVEKPVETTATREMERKVDTGRLLSELINKKKDLLDKQNESRKQLLEKISKFEKGSAEERTWSEVLSKLEMVIVDNAESLNESKQKRKEYLQKQNIVPMDSSSFKTKLMGETDKPSSTSINLEEDDLARVLVTGFENGDEEDLLRHFSQYGRIIDVEFDHKVPSATLIFKGRNAALEAKQDGRNFQDRLLNVTVFGSKKKPPPPPPRKTLGGKNPYKYTNPMITAMKASGKNPYVYRAESSPKPAESPTPQQNVVMKLTDEEDLVTFLQNSGMDAKEVEKYM